MIDVYSIALDESITIERTIASVIGQSKGPTVIFVGGIHGNEPSGIFAIKDILTQLPPSDIKGNVFGLAGNLNALSQSERFIDVDLNRVWVQDNLDQNQNQEINEAKALLNVIDKIAQDASGPIFFFDLHTTSGDTSPFLAANNTEATIDFCKNLSLPVILGVEQHINGALFGYLSPRGYVSCVFEAGQHDDPQSIRNHETFIIRSLISAGVLRSETAENLFGKVSLKGEHKEFLVKARYHLDATDRFIMNPGYKSFQSISKGEHLAHKNGQDVYSNHDGSIFLPLYQKKGEDGFFIIQEALSYLFKK